MSAPLRTHAEDPAVVIERLERRWRREREARLESERIAEAGLRRLWEAKNDLDRRVEERTLELAEARNAAEAADRAKTEFLANLGHEVRTPLQTIVAALNLARPVDAAERQRLARATDAAESLQELFTNLLELAQLEVGVIAHHPRPTDLDDVADELVHRWRAPLVAKGLLLVPESEGSATVDPDRLLQIGDALLSNACRFSRQGTVRLHLAVEGPDVVLTVTDDGPGVDPSLLDRLFEPFVRLDPTPDPSLAGSGIGLAVVRGLARHLGGDAVAGRSATGGLAVEVWIPLDPPDATARRNQP